MDHYDYSAQRMHAEIQVHADNKQRNSRPIHTRTLQIIPVEGNSVNREVVSHPQSNGLFTIITWRANFGLIVACVTGTV